MLIRRSLARLIVHEPRYYAVDGAFAASHRLRRSGDRHGVRRRHARLPPLHRTRAGSQAFYRSVVTSRSRASTRARGTGAARLISIVLALSGVAIFRYVASEVVEAIARRGVTGAGRAKEEAGDRRADATTTSSAATAAWAGGRPRSSASPGWRSSCSTSTRRCSSVARERGGLYIEGGGAEDEDLAPPGSSGRKGLVACADSDAENVYITLSARACRPDLLIVARASDEDAERKLRLAGADRVVQPYSAAGTGDGEARAASPQVAAFLDDRHRRTPGRTCASRRSRSTEACEQAGRTIRELRDPAGDRAP